MDFTIPADEGADDGDQSQRVIFVRIIGSNHRPIEHFLGITHIAISKTAAAIMDITNNFLILKEVQPFYVRFCGLDGTNSISSERCGLHNALSNILHRMLSISIAAITGLHCALFFYLKNYLH